MIVNELKYPWLAAAAISGGCSAGSEHSCSNATTTNDRSWWKEGWSLEGQEKIAAARTELKNHGAVAFSEFLTQDAVASAVEEMLSREDNAYTTNTEHTAYLKHLDTEKYPIHSIYNHPTKTIVASTAYDELSEESVLKQLYTDPRLLKMVSSIVLPEEKGDRLYLSEDPLGCCSVNVFRPGYFHGFHYDESEFSVTLMLQDAEDPESGLFQYTDPIRVKKPQNQTDSDSDSDSDSDTDADTDADTDDLTLELQKTATLFRDHEHDPGASSESSTANKKTFAEHELSNDQEQTAPTLHTLDFRPGTLLVLAGSRSLHRVTAVQGNRSRFVAVLTFASRPGFCNTPEVQEMFWGRTGNTTDHNSSCKNEELQECEDR